MFPKASDKHLSYMGLSVVQVTAAIAQYEHICIHGDNSVSVLCIPVSLHNEYLVKQ